MHHRKRVQKGIKKIYIPNKLVYKLARIFLKLNFTLALLDVVLYFPSFLINTFPNDLINKLNIVSYNSFMCL